ncbi:hypothetical protein JB92DRAFT_2574205, partial [Gautieria morchelliformis]
LACLLGIHRNTLHYKLRKLGLYHRFSTLSNYELDSVITLWKQHRPSSGLCYAVGFLQRHGLRIQ